MRMVGEGGGGLASEGVRKRGVVGAWGGGGGGGRAKRIWPE